MNDAQLDEGEPEARGHARLRLGTCPDSWGVWFADDPLQTPWTRFLDEVAEVGYRWLELGPFGYLPSDKARLADELSRRGLAVAGGSELEQLSHELESAGGAVADLGRSMEADVEELGISQQPTTTTESDAR